MNNKESGSIILVILAILTVMSVLSIILIKNSTYTQNIILAMEYKESVRQVQYGAVNYAIEYATTHFDTLLKKGHLTYIIEQLPHAQNFSCSFECKMNNEHEGEIISNLIKEKKIYCTTKTALIFSLNQNGKRNIKIADWQEVNPNNV